MGKQASSGGLSAYEQAALDGEGHPEGTPAQPEPAGEGGPASEDVLAYALAVNG
jgi:hypothetical protein